MKKNIFSKLKSVLASAAAVVMAASMVGAVPVAAADTYANNGGSNSITITNAHAGQTYTIYQLFDAKVISGRTATGNGITYTQMSGKKDSDLDGNIWFELNSSKNVVAKNGADISTADFKTWAESYGTSLGNKTNNGTEDASITFDKLKDGYYYVSTTTGSLVSVTSVAPDQNITDKNGAPTVEKTVQEDKGLTTVQSGDGTTNYQKKDDADIGQRVNYKTVITVQSGATNYVLHDTMTGLKLETGYVDSVKVGTTDVDAANYTASEPTVTAATSTTPLKSSFTITFKNLYVSGLNAGTKITVLYHATLDASAVIAGDGNPNETYLAYGEGKETAHETTKTYTWPVKVFKYYQNNQTESPLANAVFKLSTDAAGSEVIDFVTTDTNVYRRAVTDDTSTVGTITTDNTGKFTLNGLDEGTYYLTETSAPDGYVKLTAPIKIVVSSTTTNDTVETGDKTSSYTYILNNAQGDPSTAGNDGVKVLNTPGSPLPATGGIGTTVFYIVGACLIAGAAALLVVKKRRNA